MQPKARGADCANCPLAGRPFAPSKIVTGAELTIVGDAPGTQEILDGAPFVGPAGAILNEALLTIGVDPTRVAKTNAVLCRPLGNNDAPAEAVAACAGRLARDVLRAGSSRIVAAGTTAVNAIDRLAKRDNDRGILSRAGVSYRLSSEHIYTATVNPAYLIHADGYAPTFTRHLKNARFPRFADFDPNRVEYEIVSEANFAELERYVNDFEAGAPLAFDVETDHLGWYATMTSDAAALLCFVLTFEDWFSWIVPADVLARSAFIRERIVRWLHTFSVIGHNVKFDQNVSARPVPLGVNEFIRAYDDTMLMHYTLYETGSHGLKDLATEYLGAPDYEDALITSWFKANGMTREDTRRYSALPSANLYQYAAIDGAVTLQLWRIFDAELKRLDLYNRPYRETIMYTANALPFVEQTGIKLDRQQLAVARTVFEIDLNEAGDAMTAMVMPLVGTDADKSGGELVRLMTKREEIFDAPPVFTRKGKISTRRQYRDKLVYNPGSPYQTHHILYNVFGLKLAKRLIKETATKTGKEALEALPAHPFVDQLRLYRRVDKMLDTYVAGYEKRMSPNAELHVDFRITGTEIGRLSASNGDHGIPRPGDFYGAMIRSLFIADEDEVLIIGDYSQAELRAFALLAECQFLLEKYHNGEDVHTETALMLEKLGARVFRHFAEYYAAPEDTPAAHTAKEQRTLAKNVNFGGLVYMGGASGIAGMIGGKVETRIIADILQYYDVLMPEAKAYQRKQFEFLQAHGYVQTVFGRRRRFYVITDATRDDARKAAVHMPVAGSAADLTNHSAARLVNDGIRVCHTIHDSIIARARRDEAQTVADYMRRVMVETGDRYMGGVPWKADVTFGDRWIATPALPDKYKRQP